MSWTRGVQHNRLCCAHAPLPWCVVWRMKVDIQEQEHSPITDAVYAMRLFQKYHKSSPQFIQAIQQTLIASPVSQSPGGGHSVGSECDVEEGMQYG